MSQAPADAFRRSVAANIAYWRAQAGLSQPDQRSILDRERHNLFRAVEIGLALDECWRETAELMLQLFNLVERRGYGGEWLPLLEGAIGRCGPADLRLRGRLLDHFGLFCQRAGRLEAALAAHLEEEQIALQLADEELLAHARLHLSEVSRHRGRYAEAEPYGRSALEIFLALGADEEKIAHVEGNLGEIARLSGELAAAERYLNQAAERWRALDQPANLARTLNNLALAHSAAGQIDTALDELAQAAAVLEPTANELDKVMVAASEGALRFSQGDLAGARAAFLRADSTYLRQTGLRPYLAAIANNLGNVYLAEKEFGEAERCLERSVALYRQMDDRLGLANAIGGLAEALAGQGRWRAAEPLYGEAAALAAEFPEDGWARGLLAKFRQALESAGQPAPPS
jgi:tetratricopeptide (TPR) repeat protein